jgi:hypothetical protein
MIDDSDRCSFNSFTYASRPVMMTPVAPNPVQYSRVVGVRSMSPKVARYRLVPTLVPVSTCGWALRCSRCTLRVHVEIYHVFTKTTSRRSGHIRSPFIDPKKRSASYPRSLLPRSALHALCAELCLIVIHSLRPVLHVPTAFSTNDRELDWQHP